MRNKKILEKKLEEAFSITKLNTSAKKFHIGDRVLLPTQFLPSSSTDSEEEYMNAIVEGIYKYHILFRLPTGVKVSLSYFECMQVIIVEAYSNYSEKQQLEDIANAIEKKLP